MPNLSDPMHSEREQISGDCLDDVFGEFPTVGFQPAPLATRRDALVGDAGASESVLTQLWLDVGEATPGGKDDKHDPGLDGEDQCTNPGWLTGVDRLNGGSVDIGPQLHHTGVGDPPRIHQRLELGFGKSHA